MPPSLIVGVPNSGDYASFLKRLENIFYSKRFSNQGPQVVEFERKVCSFLGTKHSIAVCNATIGLEIAARALNLAGEVIVPSYTFVATAHALSWTGATPVFCDIQRATHNIDPYEIESLITHRTTGILATHLWGRPCDTEAIKRIANKHNLKVIYDAAHAFACSHQGKMIGNFGNCEVFSFHATKFLNSFEGGAITTNDDALAERLVRMRSFGFHGLDNVVDFGTNGKMTEVCAAMGLTSLESIDDIIEVNRRNYLRYCERLNRIPGVSVISYDKTNKCNFQYIVVEIDSDVCGRTRDQIVEYLHRGNIIARKYFWPGCHTMAPYANSREPRINTLTNTESVGESVIVLPTGTSIDVPLVDYVCDVFEKALS